MAKAKAAPEAAESDASEPESNAQQSGTETEAAPEEDLARGIDEQRQALADVVNELILVTRGGRSRSETLEVLEGVAERLAG